MKKRTARPRFNPRNTAMRASMTYTGELPYQHRATVTTALYVWNERKPTIWMDKRDLLGLLKDVGIDCLGGTWADGYREHKKKKAKTTAKAEGVKDGNK